MYRPIRSGLATALVAGFAMLLASGTTFAAEKFKAVTTFTVIADIARNVAGDAATVESITKPGAEIHEYQPTPAISSRRRVRILSSGMGLISNCGLRSFSRDLRMFQARW